MDVLVIDDEPVAREAVAHTLQAAGYRVRTATNGRDALVILSQEHIQLVVCDWGMPGMNGLEVCRAIRGTFSSRYIYILMLTGHCQLQNTLTGLAAGADDYVTKPFHPLELTLRINSGRRIVHSESRGVTIFAMAKLAESRDQETGDHLERVRTYCQLLARELQQEPSFREPIDDDFVRLVYDTCPLHDIGKVAIPDAILLKPGKLTAAEFEIMKTHTVQGAETLAAAMAEFPNAQFLKMAHEIALCHHERYDGRGYPQGLSGEAIPLSARIVALADVYDALTSKRVYKPAMSHERAKKVIVAERGAHFAPYVVDAFLQRESDFRAIAVQQADLVERPAARSYPARPPAMPVHSPVALSPTA